MRDSKLNIPYRLNADGQTQAEATQATSGNTPWYGYIGSWLGGVGNVISSTKEPSDVYYYNYSNQGSSSTWIWILLAVVAVVAILLFFTKK